MVKNAHGKVHKSEMSACLLPSKLTCIISGQRTSRKSLAGLKLRRVAMHVDSHCNQYLAVSISRNSAEISTVVQPCSERESDRIQQRLLHSILNVACVCRLCLITGLDCGLDCGLDHWTGLLNWILGSTKSDIYV